MTHSNTRGVAYLPAIFIVIALVAAFGVGYVLIAQPFSVTNENTNTTVNVAVQTNMNTSTNQNTNTTTNTNTGTLPDTSTHYDAPVGPFTTSDAKVVAFSYSKSSDKLVTRFAKVNAATGETEQSTQLSTVDLQSALDLPVVPSRPSLFRFGSDGDSILFVMSGTSPYPFVGIYRTSFATPKKVETILQYDKDHLLNGDIPTIADFLYNAETNTAVFVITGDQSDEKNQLLKSVTLADKKIHDLGAYVVQPQLVGFPSSGSQLEVLYTNKQHYENGKTQKVKWYYDQIRLSDGKVIATKLLLDEAKLTDTQESSSIYLYPNSISPNNKLIVYAYYKQATQNSSSPVLAFANNSTGALTAKTVAGFQGASQFLWSPDNGKVFLTTYSSTERKQFGTIYDLAKGTLADITDFSRGMLWYPSNLIVYSTTANQLTSYNLTTKKSRTIFTDAIADSYNEYGGGSQGITEIRWVNR